MTNNYAMILQQDLAHTCEAEGSNFRLAVPVQARAHFQEGLEHFQAADPAAAS